MQQRVLTPPLSDNGTSIDFGSRLATPRRTPSLPIGEKMDAPLNAQKVGPDASKSNDPSFYIPIPIPLPTRGLSLQQCQNPLQQFIFHSQIYGKEQPTHLLSFYEHRVNKAALELVLSTPSLLKTPDQLKDRAIAAAAPFQNNTPGARMHWTTGSFPQNPPPETLALLGVSTIAELQSRIAADCIWDTSSAPHPALYPSQANKDAPSSYNNGPNSNPPGRPAPYPADSYQAQPWPNSHMPQSPPPNTSVFNNMPPGPNTYYERPQLPPLHPSQQPYGYDPFHPPRQPQRINNNYPGLPPLNTQPSSINAPPHHYFRDAPMHPPPPPQPQDNSSQAARVLTPTSPTAPSAPHFNQYNQSGGSSSNSSNVPPGIAPPRGRRPNSSNKDSQSPPKKRNSNSGGSEDDDDSGNEGTTERKLHLCTVPGCGKKFTRRYNLKSHQRAHSNDRPFKCTYCMTSFSRTHDLRRHVKSLHTQQKPHQCPHCNLAFSRSDALKRHLKLVLERGGVVPEVLKTVVSAPLSRAELEKLVTAVTSRLNPTAEKKSHAPAPIAVSALPAKKVPVTRPNTRPRRAPPKKRDDIDDSDTEGSVEGSDDFYNEDDNDD
ncbi:hypothetical protein SmJEL517_g01475 [Synchytrium microbalum]|uniref:C2H2-type domain-containing protein n=1 Tax=Synchytrium microbalum TaxID=1806994 RepID=A0A507C3M8_9FUNG|nr:uncharacterized protein SmJEL517_g01475 [Synchytrium microbalum]TPX36130.1 hypothetical protein SmJEL517_g01475 [Synchytrium microbalum]